MRKHLFLSVMLGLCAFSSMTVYPTSAMATVTQSPTIKVRGQIVDEQGEPMPGATVRVKGGQGGTITDLDEVVSKRWHNLIYILSSAIFSFGYATFSSCIWQQVARVFI